MIEEIQKRPFVRPLLFFILGILIQTFFQAWFLAGGLLLFSFLLLLLSFGMFYQEDSVFRFNTRWVWGVNFAFVILSLAITITYLTEKRSFYPTPVSLIERKAIETRQTLVESIDHLSLSDTEKSVLATLTLGYKQVLTREIREKFSATGVSHILAVSGFHVAVVCSFLSFLLSIFSRNQFSVWLKYLLTMALLWSFVFLTGLAASAVRAGLMLSFYLTGRVLQRNSDSYNTLAAAAFCMLAYNPLYLFDIGFQLSYIAVFFILYLRPRFNVSMEIRNPLLSNPWQWVVMAIAAQIGTTFLCLYYFGRFSLVFLFTNLPVMLFSTFLIPAGLLWLFLPSWIPGYGWLQTFVEWLTRALVRIVDLFHSLPGASVQFDFDLFSLLTGYGMLLLFLYYMHSKKPRILLIALFLLLTLILIRLIQRIML